MNMNDVTIELKSIYVEAKKAGIPLFNTHVDGFDPVSLYRIHFDYFATQNPDPRELVGKDYFDATTAQSKYALNQVRKHLDDLLVQKN